MIYLGNRGSRKSDSKPPLSSVNPYSIIPNQIYVGLNGQIQAKVNVDQSQTSAAVSATKGWSELVIRDLF